MSWLFSRALVGVFSAANCSDGEQSAQLSVMPTQHKFWRNDKTMEFSNLSRFGLTCAVLTESRGAELLTSYLAAFPARISAQQGRAPESQERTAAYGKSSHGLLAKYDPVTYSWKTAQCSLFADSELSLETWPRWGSMRNGECYQQQMLEPRTEGIESGLWPTPTAQDGKNQTLPPSQLNRDSIVGALLRQQMWQTPVADDAVNRVSGKYNSRGEPKLSAEVKLWPTPASNNATGGATGLAGGSGNRKKLYAMLGEEEGKKMGCQSLNPNWVEWLMGWPIRWTDLRASATVRSLYAQQQHGSFSLNEQVYE